MFTRVLIIAIASLTLAPAADDPWRFVDPASRMVMGIRWRQIRESPAAAKFRQEMKQKMPVPDLPGLSFLSGIDSVLLASTGVPDGREGAQAPSLIVLSGEFDLKRVRESVNKKSRRAVVQNVEIFESTEKGPQRMGIALYSSDIVLLGDTASIVRALGGYSGGFNMMLNRAKYMERDNDFWIVSSVPPSEVGADNLPIPLPTQEIRGLEMGMAITENVGMELALEMADADAARKAKSELEKTVKLAGKEKSRPEMAGIDRHLSLTAEGNFLRMSFRIDSTALEQRMRAYQGRKAQQAPVVAASPDPPPHRPTPGGKPVIWNADK